MSGLEKIRLIGGENGGKVIEWDVAKSGPVIHTIVYPKAPTLDYTSFSRIEDQESMVYDNEVFKVERMQLGDGHQIFFGILHGMGMAMAMHELWDVYADMKQGEI